MSAPLLMTRNMLLIHREDTARRCTLCAIEIPFAESPTERIKLEALWHGLLYGVQLIDEELQQL